MTTQQYLRKLEKILVRVVQTVIETPQADLKALSNQIAAITRMSWGQKILAVGDLAHVAIMLRDERQCQGQSLHEIQTATGISISTISQIENQKNVNPSLVTLERIAGALGKKLLVAMVERDGQKEEAVVPSVDTVEQLAS